MTRARLIRAAAACAAACALASCSINVTDTSFIRPVAASEINTATASTRLPSGYTASSDFMTTADGARVYRVRFEHPAAKSTVLFFGGNMSTVEKHAIDTANALAAQWKVNLVFADYRGYGASSGTPNLETLSADAKQLFDEERARSQARNQRLVVAGYSLGGTLVGHLLETRKSDAAILIATISTVSGVVAASLPWYAKPFVTVNLDPRLNAVDNLRSVRAYAGPLLVIGAERDDQTPAAMSNELFAASSTPARDRTLVIVPGATHGNVFGREELRNAVERFSAQHGL